ncbi:hypothetical protein DPMN_051304 [Dreissena polymorpha]|uniref:Uncharacterized protein n=1 Tax=Dreissena polymorpha TaxID=45954 RepID=A0A9D4CHL9_DREPO|nr:hypothetical protein DPMN_051304 [Dreissena polymorpha]
MELCGNYRTIILISHPSKFMLCMILSRLKVSGETAGGIAGYTESWAEHSGTDLQLHRLQ